MRLPAAPDARAEDEAGRAEAARAERAKRRILVVDDNVDSAQSLAMMLEINGHTTHVAYDGLEAIEVAGAMQPEIVLMDIGMPRLNGYEPAGGSGPSRGGARSSWSRSPAGARPTTACAPRKPASTTPREAGRAGGARSAARGL